MRSLRSSGYLQARKGSNEALVAGASVDGGPLEAGLPSRRLIFGIIIMALFMTSVDSTIVSTALPTIHRSLHASINWAGWTITIYSFGMVIALPIAGRISDQFGRKRIFLGGIVLFTASSLLCGFASNIAVLIVFRALQAIGGGAFTPSAAGIVADHFGANRDRAIGLFGTIAGGGQVFGPVVGGLLVGYASWRWIFFVNVPIGVVLIALVIKVLPESRTSTSSKTDVLGLVLTMTCILSAILAITDFGDGHAQPYDPGVLVPGVLAIVLLWAFLHHTRRTSSPFIPIRLLSGRGFGVMNAENFLWGIVGFGVATLVPLYAEQRYHLRALDAGTLLTARALGMLAVGALATFALRRTGYRLPMILGFGTVALGTLLMSVSPRLGISPYLWLGMCAAITGLGNGAANPATRNACLQLAPDEVAAISGLRQMFIYIGIIFSVSIATSILNRSSDPGMMQSHIYWFTAAIIFVVMIPLVRRVPEHKGSW